MWETTKRKQNKEDENETKEDKDISRANVVTFSQGHLFIDDAHHTSSYAINFLQPLPGMASKGANPESISSASQ